MGEGSLEIYHSFTWAAEKDNIDYKKVMEKFENYFTPKKNTILERFQFNKAVQNEDDMDRFVTRLKNLATTCEFGNLKDELIRDHIVVGIKMIVQEKDYYGTKFNVGWSYTDRKTAEVTKTHLKQLQEETAEVAAVNHKKVFQKTKTIRATT